MVLEGAFRSHHHLRLVDICFGPSAIGVREFRALMADLPPGSPAGRALGMWTFEDERETLAVEVLADAALSLRTIASLLMPKGKAHDGDPPLRLEHPNRPEVGEHAEPEMTHESIQTAITAALPRR